MKICTKCKVEKPLTEFNKDKQKKDGLCSSCKGCIAYRGAAYYAANRDKRASYQAASQERIVAYRAANREKIAAKSRAWQIANPEKVAERNRNRRAMKLKVGGSHTAADVRRIFDFQQGLCANCHAELLKTGKQKFHVDHIVSLSKGGSNDKYNLQCLCPTCNLKKNSKDPFEWAKEQGKLI